MQVLDLARRRCDELETRNNFFHGGGGGGVWRIWEGISWFLGEKEGISRHQQSIDKGLKRI